VSCLEPDIPNIEHLAGSVGVPTRAVRRDRVQCHRYHFGAAALL